MLFVYFHIYSLKPTLYLVAFKVGGVGIQNLWKSTRSTYSLSLCYEHILICLAMESLDM